MICLATDIPHASLMFTCVFRNVYSCNENNYDGCIFVVVEPIVTCKVSAWGKCATTMFAAAVRASNHDFTIVELQKCHRGPPTTRHRNL